MANEDRDGRFCAVLNKTFNKLMTQETLLVSVAVDVAVANFGLI